MNTKSSLAKKSTIIGATLSVLSIICIVMFSVQYYFEKQLNFSHENKFVLFLIGSLFLFVCGFTIYFAVLINHIIKKMNTQQDNIESIYNIVDKYKINFESIDSDIAGVEDNLVGVIRDTQIMILDLKNVMGVVKCSEIRTPIEVKSGDIEIP